MPLNEPKILLRGVLDACADCDTCRFLMEEDCLFFPELYRLYDKEKNTGIPAQAADLHNLSQLCTLCGLCPCSNIRADIIRGKTEQVQKRGMPLGIRLLADVQRFGRWGSLAPRLLNSLLSIVPIERTIKKLVGIHPHRRMPRIALESFFSWAERKGLNQRPKQGPTATYFAGCTAGYFFPEVGQAAVGVLIQNGISTYIPPQQCCGMPTLLEGNSQTTLQRVKSNM
jgi:glycerol-3-phosphate dehydrogenase subunit C